MFTRNSAAPKEQTGFGAKPSFLIEYTLEQNLNDSVKYEWGIPTQYTVLNNASAFRSEAPLKQKVISRQGFLSVFFSFQFFLHGSSSFVRMVFS